MVATEQKFLYYVYPKKPIRNAVEGVPLLRSAKSLYLTKEEVLKCLKFGSVYRRFVNEDRNERVTPMTLDRLHNARFMTEAEYKAPESEVMVEEVITETEVVDKTVNGVSVEAVEELPENVVEDIVEEIEEEETSDGDTEEPVETVEEVIVPKNYNNNNNYHNNGKNKHRNRH